MPQISHLQAFLESVTCGSFAEASSNLNLSESTVSARIKVLESALGNRLFNRSKHGVVLNETGRTFLPFAQTTVGAWQQGKEAVAAAAQGKNRVSIGIQQDLWEIFAAEWFAALKKNQSDIQLSVTCDYTDILCQRVSQNLLDMAVIFKPKRIRGVTLEPLTQLSLVLVSGHDMEWSGRLPVDYYYVNWGENFSIWHQDIFHNLQTTPFSLSVSGMALASLKRNGGAAYLLEDSVSHLVDTGQVFVIEEAPRFNIEVWIARPNSIPETKYTALFEAGSLLRDLLGRETGSGLES